MTLKAVLGSRRAAVLLVVLLLSFGFLVRVQRLGSLHPFDLDERVWLLTGTSLIQKGTPASWTIFWDKYPHREYMPYGGVNHLVVVPFLDHPPLFALAVGAWAAVTGNGGPQPLNWAVLRLPMILLAVGTMALTWLFVRRLFGTPSSNLTLLAFSFFPAHIIASRFIVAENAIAFLLVLCLYAFSIVDAENEGSNSERGSKKAALAKWVIVAACGVAVLLKLSAVVVPATIALLALLRKNRQLFLWVAGATLVSALLFAGYGAFYDWDIFKDVLAGHGARPQSFWHFWSIVTQPDLGYFPLRDPSIVVGFVGLFTLMADSKIPWEKRLYIFAPLLNLSLLFLLVAPVESYGWYKYVLFPVLAVGLGHVLAELYRGKVVYYVLILPAVAVMLEQSGVVASQSQRRALVLLLYGLVAAAVLLRLYSKRVNLLPAAFALTVLTLFSLELVWVRSLLSV